MYETSAEFQQNVDTMLNDMIAADEEWKNTELGKMMYERFSESMSSEEASEWADSIYTNIGKAEDW
jgi:hypothetical protein